MASVNPVSVHHINPIGKSGTTFDMYDLFSNLVRRASFRPRMKLATFGAESNFKDHVLVHEELVRGVSSYGIADGL